MSIGRKGWQVTFKNGKEGPGGPRGSYAHAENFIKAVRSRKTSDLNADVEVGHRSAALCHMANIAMRAKESVCQFHRQNHNMYDKTYVVLEEGMQKKLLIKCERILSTHCGTC
jgi:hypothetical protein